MNVIDQKEKTNEESTTMQEHINAAGVASHIDEEAAGLKQPPAETKNKKKKLSYAEAIPCQPRRERSPVPKKEGKSLSYAPTISPADSRRRPPAKPLMTEKNDNTSIEENVTRVGAFRCGKNLDNHSSYNSNDIEQGESFYEEEKDSTRISDEGLQPIVAILAEEADSKLRKLEEENMKLRLREQNTPFAEAELLSSFHMNSSSTSFFRKYKKTLIGILTLITVTIVVIVVITMSNESAESSAPSLVPSLVPSTVPSLVRSSVPSSMPSSIPSSMPSSVPSSIPSLVPSTRPSSVPTSVPSLVPTSVPSAAPSAAPSIERIKQITGNKFKVELVEGNGRYFKIAADNFPVPINSFENKDIKTTIRVFNARTNITKGVMLQLFPETDLIRGYYNPQEYTKEGDFMVGDELEAVDYQSLIENDEKEEGSCIQQEFSIVGVNRDIAWNVPASNIRIGKLGVVGSFYADFEYTVHLEKPVTALWTDAVGIKVQYSTGSWYSDLTPRENDPALRNFDEPLSGIIRISFFNANTNTLNGLVTQRDTGGLHMAFCT